ncbi:MAG: hypothetical protein BroJett026_17030 [Betaproteobacteria bacterium]|nr:MAG: hypothetical protein BroJett026_17030 [Betaproteobacteria bacterium]
MSDADGAAFAAEDLARLDALLAAPPHAGRSLRPDALHGMLCALAIGPDPFPSDDSWIGVALDDGGRARDPELADLLRRFAARTRADLAAGRCEPLLYALRRGRHDYRSWCEGFLAGVNAAASDWFAYGEPEDVDELIAPIELLADALPPEARARLSPQQWRRRVLEAEAGLPGTLERLRAFWTIVREPPATFRRDGAKVGRNDPCPCGSGRKFKQCHGRA